MKPSTIQRATISTCPRAASDAGSWRSGRIAAAVAISRKLYGVAACALTAFVPCARPALCSNLYTSRTRLKRMSARRVFGIALLGLGASCARNGAPNTQVAPDTTVKASIYATYSGGLVDRQADAVFKVDKTAYVMVAHLSGDGRVEVLFPEDGRESGYLKG